MAHRSGAPSSASGLMSILPHSVLGAVSSWPLPIAEWCQMRRVITLTLLLTCASVAAAQNPPRQELKEVSPEKVDTAVYQRLRYRYIGPEGNRVTSVAGVPGDPNTYYAGAASGGLWKSTDGGIHWDAVFDKQPVSSVGAIAVAPSDPNVVYAGTGEPFTRSHHSPGGGTGLRHQRVDTSVEV